MVERIERHIVALKDGGWLARKDAAKALGRIGGSRAVEALIAAFNDENEDVRTAAAEALAKMDSLHVVELLIEVRVYGHHGHTSVRRYSSESDGLKRSASRRLARNKRTLRVLTDTALL